MKFLQTERGLLCALLLLAAALALGTCAWGDLYNETDGQYGGAAKVMAHGGSWIIPENNGVPRLVKPPLLYWAMATSIRIFGVNEFAARVPCALSLCAWVTVTFLIGVRLGGPWRGFMAGAILLTSLGTFTLGRIIMPEPAFSALIAAALYCALRGVEDAGRRRRWFLGFWLCASLASFTKGWHGLLYPLAIVGGAALFAKGARPSLRGLLSWQGPVIFILINLPWYFYLDAKFPGYLQNLFFTEQLGHVTGSHAPATGYTNVPRGQFFLLHLAWFFPWSLLALGAWMASFKSGGATRHFPNVLLVAWAVIVMGSVLLTGQRQDYYAMAMWPAFALWAAGLLEQRSLRRSAVALAMLLGIALVAAASLPVLTAGEVPGTVADRATAWTTVTNFDRSVWSSLQSTAWFTLGSAFIFSLAAIWLRNRLAFVAVLAAAAALDLGAISGTAIVAPYFSLARVAPVLSSLAPHRLVYDGDVDTGSSLLFYTDLPIILLDQDPTRDFIVRKFQIGRDRYTTTSELAAWWHSPESVVLVTESRRLPEWQNLFAAPDLAPVARSGTQVILKNHP